MVSSVSSSSAASAVLGSSSSSSQGGSDIQAQLAAKKAEFAKAKDDATKQSLQSEIDALEAQLAKIEAAKSEPLAAPAGRSTFSGESDRLGSGNVADEAEFGERFLYV